MMIQIFLASDAQRRCDEEDKDIHAKYCSYLQQKAKLAWGKDRNENYRMFHLAIRARRLQNTVYGIVDMNEKYKLDEVNDVFLQYYIHLLGTAIFKRGLIQQVVIEVGQVLNDDHISSLMAPYSYTEVKEVLFSILGDKSPGPYGYGSYFFQRCLEHSW